MSPLWLSLDKAGDVSLHFNTVILMQVAHVSHMEQGLASSFWEGPDSKYLRLCGPYPVSQLPSLASVVREPPIRQCVRLAVFQ